MQILPAGARTLPFRVPVYSLPSFSMLKSADACVLIIGAGPTGLGLALCLACLGVKVRIIDKTAEPGTTSRALGVHARTLEFYRQLGLAEAVVGAGIKTAGVNLWVNGSKAAHVPLSQIGEGQTAFPYFQERLLTTVRARSCPPIGFTRT